MARIDEIAPDLSRISIYVPQIDLQFNHLLLRDGEPLLFHTGMRRMFPDVRDAVGRVLDPATICWISWSHFEVDECGALNDWLAIAPRAWPPVARSALWSTSRISPLARPAASHATR